MYAPLQLVHQLPALPHAASAVPGWHVPALSQHPEHVDGPQGGGLASCDPPELEVDELDELLEAPPELELVDEPPSKCTTPPDDDDELELLEDGPPELEELEAGAASVPGRRPPSSAGDSPSPSPIWPRASPLSGATDSTV